MQLSELSDNTLVGLHGLIKETLSKENQAGDAPKTYNVRREPDWKTQADDIVLEGLRDDDSIAELCHKEGIAQGVYTNGRKTLWKLRRNYLLAYLYLNKVEFDFIGTLHENSRSNLRVPELKTWNFCPLF